MLPASCNNNYAHLCAPVHRWRLCARAVPEAYTPVLKFKMREVPVDMLFCSLRDAALPRPLDVREDRHLGHLDAEGVRSLNGVRVAELILEVSAAGMSALYNVVYELKCVCSMSKLFGQSCRGRWT
jgi:poly(A) polymerase Pap1